MTDMIEVERRAETLEEFTLLHWDTVQDVAQQVYRRYHVSTAEDLAGDLWVEVTRTFDKAFKDQGPEAVRKRLYRAASRLQSQEQIDYMYFSGAYIYTPREVRAYLETCAWAPEDEVPDVDARVDMQQAFQKLPPKQRLAVYKRFALKEPASALSEAEKRNEERGVDNITHTLNRWAKEVPEKLDVPAVLDEVEQATTGLPGKELYRGARWGYGNEYGGEQR
ncbi:hypothetical protein Q7C18_02690 [Nesterenkonia sp. CL21]|uniref:hypothetical protein n=1 Tax=Nesterenkonia sp. CL21 TaxID=3064894 RepID=UPI002879B087|nr:hypothetical protein [Nesterenkonia sp. CL21]MDS2171596.1 hypothetical protein [Nesterenkonia sp. CL21]